jgi:hypothetical protein
MMGCGLMSAPPIEVPMEITAEAIGTVDQTSSVVSSIVNNVGMDWKTLLLFTLLAGWAIPGPGEILRMLAGPFGYLKWW